MAGDWLKFEKATLDKPEVFEMAGALGIDPDAVIGKLLRVWNWFDDQTENGTAKVTARALLDRYAGVTGFVAAMESVGWAEVSGKDLIVPHFSRHNGNPAKTRALGKSRSETFRKSNAKSNAACVTNALPEKRREESKEREIGAVGLCTLDQAKGYAGMARLTESEAEHWWNTRNASGWTKGGAGGAQRTKITSWQSDMASSTPWVKEGASKRSNGQHKGMVENIPLV